MYNDVSDFLPINSSFFHVALIPDGARRWARKNNISYNESYLVMVEKVVESIEYLFSHNVDVVSVYFSSIYNFKRPASEVVTFCEAETIFFNDLIQPVADTYKVAVHAVGDISAMDSRMVNAINTVEQNTRKNTNKKLFICVNYSSIVEMSKAADKTTDKSLVNYLSIPYPVNMLIRTGNANVLSDFLLPQCSFARLFFLRKLFNDITCADYRRLLKKYREYDLKYGE